MSNGNSVKPALITGICGIIVALITLAGTLIISFGNMRTAEPQPTAAASPGKMAWDTFVEAYREGLLGTVNTQSMTAEVLSVGNTIYVKYTYVNHIEDTVSAAVQLNEMFLRNDASYKSLLKEIRDMTGVTAASLVVAYFNDNGVVIVSKTFS